MDNCNLLDQTYGRRLSVMEDTLAAAGISVSKQEKDLALLTKDVEACQKDLNRIEGKIDGFKREFSMLTWKIITAVFVCLATIIVKEFFDISF